MAKGPLVLVTGATDGIGKETACALAARGARVVVHGRSAEKVAAAAREIAARGEAPAGEEVADLASFAAVRTLAARLLERHGGVDVLLNNAGVVLPARQVTEDGFEATFAINHLAPLLLTHLLVPALRARPGSRVVNVASGVHVGARLDWDDLQSERRYDGVRAYGLSKLANVLFTAELARRLGDGPPMANSLHPGVVGTKLMRAGWGGGGWDSLADAARTSVVLALDPPGARTTGGYFQNGARAKESPLARDPAVTARFYELSCAMAGVDPLPARA